MNPDILLRAEGVRVAFPEGEVVSGVDLSLERGEALALVGRSGSGKTMLARALLGLPPAGARMSGRVVFLGRENGDLPGGPCRLPAGRCAAMICQDSAGSLDPVRRVGDQVVETLRLRRGLGRADARTAARALLAEAGLPDPDILARRYPHQLSGGQRQRVNIALALAVDPALLIADEPTTALDAPVRDGILKLLGEVRRRRRMGLVLITHDLGLVRGNADRLAVMSRGRIVESGFAEDLLAAPEHEQTRLLLDAAAMVRRPFPEPPGPPRPVLEIRGLKVVHRQARQQSVTALDGVDLEVAGGEIVGLAGESGCGKTTLARAVAGHLRCDGGSILVGGRGPAPAAGEPAPAQLIFQEPSGSLNPRLSVIETVAEACRLAGAGDPSTAARGLLAEVGLAPSLADRFPHELSGGEQQRVAVARALAADPVLLVADEPTSSLDVTVQAALLETLRDLVAARRIGLLLISHDSRLLRCHCRRVVRMRRGRIEKAHEIPGAAEGGGADSSTIVTPGEADPGKPETH